MRYFFIENLKDLDHTSSITISGSDERHIKQVLRLGPGDAIRLFDETGAEYEAKIVSFSKTGVDVVATQRLQTTRVAKIELNIAQALLKDKKMDGLIRPLTELGATRLIPFISHRSVPRLDRKRLSSRTERWDKIAKESLKQCRRGYILRIEEIVSFETMLDRASGSDLKIAFWEESKEPIESVIGVREKEAVKTIFAMLGPEGGLTSDEIRMAVSAGFVTASLGPRILRAETAAVASCTILQYLFGDMG